MVLVSSSSVAWIDGLWTDAPLRCKFRRIPVVCWLTNSVLCIADVVDDDMNRISGWRSSIHDLSSLSFEKRRRNTNRRGDTGSWLLTVTVKGVWNLVEHVLGFLR